MPYKIVWHSDLSALVVHYEGSVSLDDYLRMCAERAEWIDKAAGSVSVVMDMRSLQNFPDAAKVDDTENVLQHENVQRVLIVVDDELYEKLQDAVVDDTQRLWPVHFFSDVEQALAFIEQAQ